MEQRSEPRFQPNQNQNVTIKVIGSGSGPAIEAFMLNLSCSGMSLRSKLPIAPGTAIEIDLTDMVAHGNVSRCRLQDGAYVIGVQISKTTPVPKASGQLEQRRSMASRE